MEKIGKPANNSEWGGAFDAFGRVAKQALKNPAPLVIIVVAYLLLTVVESKTIGPVPENVDWSYFSKYSLIEMVFGLVFLLAIPTYGLALARQRHISVEDFFKFDGGKFVSMFLASILFVLAVVGSLALLVIPAIWVVAWYSLYQFAVLDKNKGAVDALKESKRLIMNHKGKVWGVVGVALLLAIASSLVLATLPTVGRTLSDAASMITGVLCTGAAASLYLWAKRQATA